MALARCVSPSDRGATHSTLCDASSPKVKHATAQDGEYQWPAPLGAWRGWGTTVDHLWLVPGSRHDRAESFPGCCPRRAVSTSGSGLSFALQLAAQHSTTTARTRARLFRRLTVRCRPEGRPASYVPRTTSGSLATSSCAPAPGRVPDPYVPTPMACCFLPTS